MATPGLHISGVRSEGLSAELLLAATCCIWPHSELRKARLYEQLAGPIRWELLLRIVKRHRIVGLAHHGLEPFASQIPAPIFDELKTLFAQQARQSLLLAAETFRIVKGLQDAGVESLVLKGSPVATLAYGNLALRHSKDIDLLVSPGMVDEATRHLAAVGYSRVAPAPQCSAEDVLRWRLLSKNFEYVHTTSKVYLEMHWRPMDNRYLMPHGMPLQRQQVMISHGLSLPTLSQDELLLYLCAHGATHAWSRLKWLADIGALLHRKDPSAAHQTSAEFLLQKARACGLERPVEQGFALCNQFFGSSLPSPAKRDVASRALLRVAIETISAGEGVTEPPAAFLGTTRIALSAYLLRKDWKYRFEQLRFDTALRGSSPSRFPVWLQPIERVVLWMWNRLRNTGRSRSLP